MDVDSRFFLLKMWTRGEKGVGHLEIYSIIMDVRDGFLVYGGTHCENP